MHRLLWSGVFISLEQMVGMTMAGSLLRQCCRDFCCCCLFKNGQMVLQSGSSIYSPSSNVDPFPYSLATICFCYYSYFRWFTYCVVMLTCDLFILVFVVYVNMHEHGFTCSCGDQKSTSGVQLYNFITLFHWGRVSSWTSLAGGQQATGRTAPVFSSQSLKLQVHVDTSRFLSGCWRLKLRSSCLHSKCSQPVNHLLSLFHCVCSQTFFGLIIYESLAVA